MKTIFLYLVFLLGIPNFLGLLIGFPLAMLLVHSRIGSPTDFASESLVERVGGVVNGYRVWRGWHYYHAPFRQMPGGAVPVISGAWALFYYYSRGQPKTEAWAYVAGIYVALVSYWLC